MTVTVAQLIRELQQYPEDVNVDVHGLDGDFGFLMVEDQIVLDGDEIVPEHLR